MAREKKTFRAVKVSTFETRLNEWVEAHRTRLFLVVIVITVFISIIISVFLYNLISSHVVGDQLSSIDNRIKELKALDGQVQSQFDETETALNDFQTKFAKVQMEMTDNLKMSLQDPEKTQIRQRELNNDGGFDEMQIRRLREEEKSETKQISDREDEIVSRRQQELELEAKVFVLCFCGVMLVVCMLLVFLCVFILFFSSDKNRRKAAETILKQVLGIITVTIFSGLASIKFDVVPILTAIKGK